MSKSRAVKLALAFGLVLPFSVYQPTEAATIIGGSGILSAIYATQVESWLVNDPTLAYSGALTFENVYSKNPGDTFADFHLAADLKGPTIVVMEAFPEDTSITSYQILGGFNPVSWFSTVTGLVDDYTHSPIATEAERTAFIFNLTSGERRDQSLTDSGLKQTYNHFAIGPTFASGHDLTIYTDMDHGYVFSRGYCPDINVECFDPILVSSTVLTLMGGTGVQTFFDVGKVDIFTISQTSPVPLPAALPMLAAGLGAMGFMGWRKRRKTA
jgi:hypothetical protein